MNTVSPTTHHIAASAACRGINHVLKAEPWAMAELARHAGKVILLSLPIGQFFFEIAPEGSLLALTHADAPSLELEVSPEALSALAGGPGNLREQAMKSVKITGDADLAQLLGRLAGQIRWEYEEDLARFIGDAPANFAVRQGKKLISAGKSAATDLLDNVIEYVSEERKVLLNKRDFLIRKNELSVLRDAVDRLDKRIQLLERKG
ncbi:MAG: SCP2 sterol-binding domain-containing protein [Rhodoferax sp.]|uniref:ubiquinone biosynthesis accessory factor UbiJ n=1 Tax=Polynucleobacter sp. MG-Unter2-18 TaxID=2081052 RepID=UPI001BFE5581|nr:SCP2 sterol-binding domain-containing protein [Polynucleobacter sp. MG-Unter2-18]MCF8166285.1 SCP2 sterol-binding domain-containing protein [Rhodoferax sp.]MCF8191148.1 SCP2 sterol-binding domain-containing protein [Polynucleobacter sp.]QWD94389.1 SCP2 sterol-binding domain-containing protein [Polynucleobacter sp. MG-Unter2-18]